jgi:putative PIN family toxin of toxin-antitoxin system
LKRVVVDSNVLLSALVGNPEASPAILLEAIHEHVVEMVACPALIAEVRENLTEPYFRALLSEREAEQAVSTIERVAVMLKDPVDPEPVLRDRSDDYLVALARSAQAEIIVTGDKDLLDHAGLQPPAISAREAAGTLAGPPHQ